MVKNPDNLIGGFVSGGGLVFGVLGNTLVLNISDISVLVSGVGDNLDTTVGKVDTVFSSSVIVITALLLAENWSVSGIVYSIFVVVHWGKDGLSSIRSRGGVVGSWGSSRDGRGNSQEAGGKSKLKKILEVQSCKQFYLIYCKVASRSTSGLIAHSKIFKLFLKGKFDAYVL